MTDQPDVVAEPTRDLVRDGNGRFTRDPTTATRDAEIAALHTRGLSYRAIGLRLGIHPSTAHEAVQRVLRETVEPAAAEVRAVELERLDAGLERLSGLEASVRRVLERRHVTVQQGRVVYLGDEPLEDDAPVLAAVDRLVRIEDARLRVAERRARLLGLDSEQRLSVSGGVRYEVVGVAADDLT